MISTPGLGPEILCATWCDQKEREREREVALIRGRTFEIQERESRETNIGLCNILHLTKCTQVLARIWWDMQEAERRTSLPSLNFCHSLAG